MGTPTILITPHSVRSKYPGVWDVTTGAWGQVTKKSFGPFMCTALAFHGQQVRWRVKELILSMDANQEYTKEWRIRGAGRASDVMGARYHMETNVVPALLSVWENKNAR